MGQTKRRKPKPSSSPVTSTPAVTAAAEVGASGETPEYERQRLARIKENKARMEALGLPSLASTLFPASNSDHQAMTRIKGKKKADSDEDDDEYQPSDHDDVDDDDDGSEEDEDGESKKGSSASRSKGKKKITSKQPKSRKKLLLAEKSSEFDDFIDEDTSLQQAIALSLGGPMDRSSNLRTRLTSNPDSDMAESGPSIRKDKSNMHEPSGKKNKIMTKRRVQLTEDEVVAYFFSFDEVGKGYVTVHDLQKMAINHDFGWTEKELYNMIHCFDRDGDGKLNLNDFRTIVFQCNMLQGQGDS